MNVNNCHLDKRWKVEQHQAGILLGGGATIAEAAARVRVDKRTVYRWLEDPEFKQYVDGMRVKAFDESLRVIAGITTKAAKKFDKLMDSADESVQLRAAEKVFDTAFKADDRGEFDRRLANLEARRAAEIALVASATSGESGDHPGDPAPDDEFADLLRAGGSDDEHVGMARNLRGHAAVRHRPGRNGRGNGTGPLP